MHNLIVPEREEILIPSERGTLISEEQLVQKNIDTSSMYTFHNYL